MSRSFDQFRYTRGGDIGGEYSSKRMGGGYPIAGRFTKTLTHRVERREARREIETVLRNAEWREEAQEQATMLDQPLEGMMRMLYVVKGATGEYADRREWTVCGYFDKAKAEQHMSNLNALAEALLPPRHDPQFWTLLESATTALREVDPQGSVDYTGTWYDIEDVPVVVEE